MQHVVACGEECGVVEVFIDEDEGTDETLSEIVEIQKSHNIPFSYHRIANKVSHFFFERVQKSLGAPILQPLVDLLGVPPNKSRVPTTKMKLLQ